VISYILNGTLLDTERMALVGERHLIIEDERIVAVDEAAPGGHDVSGGEG
jgi:hypothetical protein